MIPKIVRKGSYSIIKVPLYHKDYIFKVDNEVADKIKELNASIYITGKTPQVIIENNKIFNRRVSISLSKFALNSNNLKLAKNTFAIRKVNNNDYRKSNIVTRYKDRIIKS